jgi:starch synthase
VNILFATTEAVPFCKTGGLGDVCGSLPRELAALGHHVSMVLPAFRQALDAGQRVEPTGVSFELPLGRKLVRGSFLRSQLPDCDVPVYLVEQDYYFDRPELYRASGADYQDNCERFVFFQRAVFEAIRLFDLQTDLIHCHDWPTGLIPIYLKSLYRDDPALENVATLFTIHNLAYQGSFWHWDMELTGLDWKHFNWRELEFYGQLNFLKAALVHADVLTTVSPTYAQEIQFPPLSSGLEGVLQYRREDLFGVLNGADYTEWNPAADRHLVERYDLETVAHGKAACKAALQRELGLPERGDVPLLASVGRLVDQKGFDLVAEVMQQWAGNRDVQWAILGTGEHEYHELLARLATLHPDRVGLKLGFSEPLAHRIEAAADIYLMPSRYEPCGLNQIYSLKYGTVPVVRQTGGLADTIVDATPHALVNRTANGFSFVPYTTDALAETIDRACQAYFDRPVWQQLIHTGMKQDWSWRRSAVRYGELYERATAKRGQLAGAV